MTLARRGPATTCATPIAVWLLRWLAAVALLTAFVLGFGVAAASWFPDLDHAGFVAINRHGPAPEWVWDALDPHLRNYILLLALPALMLIVRGLRPAVYGVVRVLAGALLAWALLEAVYHVYDRPRPGEQLDAAALVLDGNSWARIESYPSGHTAVTAALVVGAALVLRATAFPRWGLWLLGLYLAAVAVSRVWFGAHFPSDSVGGVLLGAGAAVAVERLRRRIGVAALPAARWPRHG